MAATPSIQDSEARVFSIAASIASSIRVPEARVFAIYNFPSEEIQSSEVRVFSPLKREQGMQVSESRVFAIVRGRVENRRLRAWGFSLDGHDFYVLRLGETSSLIHDLTTGEWMQWDGDEVPFWRANCGWQWIGMGFASLNRVDGKAATRVVVGDDTFGLLWTLDPEQGYDEHPDPLAPDQERIFIRQLIGGIPMRLRDTKQVGAAYVTMDTASPQIANAFIQLRTSDDYGITWLDHGNITITPGNLDQEYAWRSLGLIKHPGRIFEITDNGATARIDGLDIR